MYKRIFCDRCNDTGKVGLFVRKICPVCNGTPEAYWKKTHPKPKLPPPPQGGSSESKPKPQEIHIYVHTGEK